jgi:hypothetical protein
MIFSSHIRLDSFSVGGSFTIDILSSLVSSDKGNSLDILMFAYLLSCLKSSLNHVNYTLREIDFLQ